MLSLLFSVLGFYLLIILLILIWDWLVGAVTVLAAIVVLFVASAIVVGIVQGVKEGIKEEIKNKNDAIEAVLGFAVILAIVGLLIWWL
ncbi:hypothetical protein ACFOGI_05700 [Virgibacillus xinjiangensis]|uniref:Uncharacterized protein n=1 Tax=Virgibacillus xinjiangensis TaxID=393090 RepID=A0ABV7CUB8_9BACI